MRLLTFIITLVFIGYSELLIAHGGGLDSNGCHHNRKTGDYHCHRSGAKSNSSSSFSLPSYRAIEKESCSQKVPYDRSLYKFNSYPTSTSKGFYTGRVCTTNIDHAVSLKDAHDSGASCWTSAQRDAFANDRMNHVASCDQINSSKGSSTPKDFLKKSGDGHGLEYDVITKCAYLGIYFQIKQKYRLSYANNDSALFLECGIRLD